MFDLIRRAGVSMVRFVVLHVWNTVLLVLGVGAFFLFLAWPIFVFDLQSEVIELWSVSAVVGLIYGVSIWFVVSGDTREISIVRKILSAMHRALNILLLGILVLTVYIMVLSLFQS